ncbi:PREDICTED: uncharacterized protein LOC108573792 [Habropoda laboriosa]|uniref:uncharacterized protein LOC108573792 n=1 Tax=Habropoda laboriosa TaxID=597456 RepID=UPI00083CB676|nr:PREDICTED: uncharacterized protein LOC108573792 [Habropoda laboriosa]
MLEFSVQHAEVALSTAAENVGDGIQGHDNDTESLQLLSHLDPPVDTIYMICGVLIALVLVGVIIVLLAVTISKLRKREDHTNTVHPDAAVVQTATSPVSTIVAQSYPVEGCTQTSMTTATDLGNSTAVEQDNNVYTMANTTDQFVWQFPPPYPPPHTPTQYALYNDQVGLLDHFSGC